MAASANRVLVTVLGMAAGGAPSGGGCDCEAVCGQRLAEQQREIARLRAEVRALRGSNSPLAALHAVPRRTRACDGVSIIIRPDQVGLADVMLSQMVFGPGCTSMQDLTITGATSLWSLQRLWKVNRLEIHHCWLYSLEHLKGLTEVTTGLIIRDNSRLQSIDGLQGLRTVRHIQITGNSGLRSLSGLHRVESADAVVIRGNGLEDVSGLDGLQTVGRIEISEERQLRNIAALKALRRAALDITLTENPQLGALSGLENLESTGYLRVQNNERLQWLFPGLQSLTRVLGDITLTDNALTSLHGLGALSSVELLLVRNAVGRMKFLGAPFAAGAQVNVVYIDKASWPSCVTPHERSVLASAVGRMDLSFVPNATQQWWDAQCQGRPSTPLVCTQGLPCRLSFSNFSLFSADDEFERVFISGQNMACGACPESRLQSRVTDDNVVDFGYATESEERGIRSVCLCRLSGPPRPGDGPVAQLVLRGPTQSGLTVVCISGQRCTSALSGELLERTDQVVLMSSCSNGNPLLGFEASWAAENEVSFQGAVGWYAAVPARYQVCWRAPCTDDPEAPKSCSGGSFFHAGNVELLGPSSKDYEVVLGENLTVLNIGFGVSDNDVVRLMRSCGEANNDGTRALEAKSSSMFFDLGRLTLDRVRVGSHRLCWCQEHDGNNGVKCNTEEHFVAESGTVQILCPVGQQPTSSGRCEECPPGKQQPKAGLEQCWDCPAGRSSPGSEGGCQACQPGAFAALVGSSACAACAPWESAGLEATGCSIDPQMLVLSVSFALSVATLCAVLVRSTGRRISVVDVSLDQGHTILTASGAHGFSNFGRVSFPVALRGTGHPGLDHPRRPLRARVRDAARLELLTQEGGLIGSGMDTSMGTLRLASPYNLYHQGWPVPLVVSVPALSIVSMSLGGLVLDADVAEVAFPAAAAAALAFMAVLTARRCWPRSTPLAQRLKEFKKKKLVWHIPTPCEKGPQRAIEVGKLHELLSFFREFIRDRAAYFLASNILVPLTAATRLSYAELVGCRRVQWFVSHFWGTPFHHFCTALRKHAETTGVNDWTAVSYWVCFCSNNQHKIEEELGSGWQESSFYVTLRSGHCQGTCMVLDDEALPLKRIWCIFELLQTVKLERNTQGFQGLLFCTSGGVLNTGSGSVDVAMALARKVSDMDLATAEATKEQDALLIRAQVIQEMGSFTALNRFVCHEVHDMLVHAHANSNQQFAAVLAHLEESTVLV